MCGVCQHSETIGVNQDKKSSMAKITSKQEKIDMFYKIRPYHNLVDGRREDFFFRKWKMLLDAGEKGEKQVWGFCFTKCLAVSMEGALNIISAVAASFACKRKKEGISQAAASASVSSPKRRHVYGSRRTDKGKGRKTARDDPPL